MANVFIVLGVILLVAGLLMKFFKSGSENFEKKDISLSDNVTVPSKNIPSTIPDTLSPSPVLLSPSDVRTVLSENPSSSPTKDLNNYDENKLKGDAFEKYVVKRFNRKFFNIMEWRSDKYVDGIYAVSNHFPDLELLFKAGKIKDSFAIECKWRKDYYRNGIEWASDYQIENYIKYAKDISIPVFIVIGVGGEPDDPGELFIIPLDSIESNVIPKAKLLSYKKYKKDFYWDASQKSLK